jgi:enoyl-CoA hydratase
VVLERVSPHVAVVTLNRPEARNAVDVELTRALDEIVRVTEADADIRVVVLAARGERVFCSGADLKAVAGGSAAALFTREGGFAGFVDAYRNKPWIAAVDGLALAGGLEILLACDLRVASPRSAFGLPEVKRGLMALAGGLYRLPRALPRAVALEMITTGDNLGAERAWQLGLLNHLVEAEQVLTKALELAEIIAGNAPVAVRESLRVARSAIDYDEAELRKMSKQARNFLVTTEDYAEGPRAFVEKRAPVWKGR